MWDTINYFVQNIWCIKDGLQLATHAHGHMPQTISIILHLLFDYPAAAVPIAITMYTYFNRPHHQLFVFTRRWHSC